MHTKNLSKQVLINFLSSKTQSAPLNIQIHSRKFIFQNLSQSNPNNKFSFQPTDSINFSNKFSDILQGINFSYWKAKEFSQFFIEKNIQAIKFCLKEKFISSRVAVQRCVTENCGNENFSRNLIVSTTKQTDFYYTIPESMWKIMCELFYLLWIATNFFSSKNSS